jgi:hypothetical protein
LVEFTLVSGLDISTAVIYLSGLEAGEGFQGMSLFPLFKYPAKGTYVRRLVG